MARRYLVGMSQRRVFIQFFFIQLNHSIFHSIFNFNFGSISFNFHSIFIQLNQVWQMLSTVPVVMYLSPPLSWKPLSSINCSGRHTPVHLFLSYVIQMETVIQQKLLSSRNCYPAETVIQQKLLSSRNCYPAETVIQQKLLSSPFLNGCAWPNTRVGKEFKVWYLDDGRIGDTLHTALVLA